MKNPILNQSIINLLGISLGLLGYLTYGYFISYIIGQLVTLINMKRSLPRGFLIFSVSTIYRTLKESKKFIIYQLPTNIIAEVKSQTPTFLISSLWGTHILGYYSITVRLLQVPSTLLAKAIGRVFFQVAADMKRSSKAIGEYVLKNINNGMKIAFIPMIILMTIGDLVVFLFLGENWIVAGKFVRILALQYFFMFLQSSVHGISIILDRQKYALIANTVQLIMIVIALCVGRFLFDSITIALLLMSGTIIIIQLFYFSILFRVMDIAVKRYLFSATRSITIMVILSISIRWILNYFELSKLIL